MEDKKEVYVYNRSAVILAAGKGTRFGEDLEYNKCAATLQVDPRSRQRTTFISALINTCLSVGIYNLHIVVGFQKESIIKEGDRLLQVYKNRFKITYVENDKYDEFDEAYSLKLGYESALKDNPKEIYILEADTLIAPDYLRRLRETPGNCTLVRPEECIKEGESIIALTFKDNSLAITNFVASKKDGDIFNDDIANKFCSCRAWKLSFWDESYKDSLVNLRISESDNLCLVMSKVGTCIKPFIPVFVDPMEGIWDMDTQEDYTLIKKIFSMLQ